MRYSDGGAYSAGKNIYNAKKADDSCVQNHQLDIEWLKREARPGPDQTCSFGSIG